MNDPNRLGELLDALVSAAYLDGMYGADEWSHTLVLAKMAVLEELGFVEGGGHAH